MLKYKKGNLLESHSEALVNTVNTVGVMGKGIALQFKEEFPKNYKEYKRACENGEVVIGKMFVTRVENDSSEVKYIINFPTKKHWKEKSKISYIESGLADLKNVIKQLNIKSISVPPLGCGNGGLNWIVVREKITKEIGDLDIDLKIYEPQGIPVSKRNKKKPNLTKIRSYVLEALSSYEVLGFQSSLVELQKLSWFLQRLGLDLKLNFVRKHYGPYAHNLTFLLEDLDGYYITGMKYKQAKPFDLISLVDTNFHEVEKFSAQNLSDSEKNKIKILTDLIRGFETPFGMELLATIDYLITEQNDFNMSTEKLISLVSEWSKRKAKLFKPDYVEIAHARLLEFKSELY